MKSIYFYIIEFLTAVIIVVLYYKLIETRKIKKYAKEKLPVDLKLFINTQKIDVKKISYKKLMNIVTIVNAIDVGIIILITNIVDKVIFKILIAIPACFIMLFISYKIAGLILKKKGLTKDESQRN